jgi:hypothetical protein
MAAGSGTSAASFRALIVTTTDRACAMCSLHEQVKPRRLVYRDATRVITLSKVTWTHWGRATTVATASATVTIGPDIYPGRATISVFRLLGHRADRCRARPTDRMYTRATIRPGTAAPAAAKLVTLRLPASGCP